MGEPCTGRGNPFSGRDVTWGNLVLGGGYGGTSIGPGDFFLGPDTEYKGNPSYRRVWGNLGRAGGTFF